MAKFCQNCGSALGEGTKFCPGCGTPVPQASPQQQPVQPQQTQPPQQQQYQQPQQPAPQQRQYAPQPQVHIPQQFAQKNAARAQNNAPVKKKKGKGGLIAVIIILLVVVIGAVCFFGFRDGGWFKGKDNPQSNPTTNEEQSNFEALLDYANRLEAAGNEEAAAKVRALIPEAAAGEARQKAYEQQEENSDLQLMEDIEDAIEAYNLVKGGK